jgi:hypothetical protein
METNCIATTNVIVSSFPAIKSLIIFFPSWTTMLVYYGWAGVLAWLAVLVTLVVAIVTAIRYRHPQKPTNALTLPLFYPVAYVSFLFFFSVIGFSPFSAEFSGVGRVDAGSIAFLFGETFQILASGSCLFLCASIVVATTTKVYPKFTLLEIGPVLIVAITWALSLGGCYFMPYLFLGTKIFTCSLAELFGGVTLLFILAFGLLALIRYSIAIKRPTHVVIFYYAAYTYVCFLVFFGGMGLTPFLIDWARVGRPDPEIILYILELSLIGLASGAFLFLTVCALVAGAAEKSPRFYIVFLWPIIAAGIVWEFIVGVLLVRCGFGF